jgi:hypothetical protein
LPLCLQSTEGVCRTGSLEARCSHERYYFDAG